MSDETILQEGTTFRWIADLIFSDETKNRGWGKVAYKEQRLAEREFREMTARRSFEHSLGKFETRVVDKPIAILTAWRGTLLDQNGQVYAEADRRRKNDEANELLKVNIRHRNLSFHPVIGAGQEQDEQGVTTVNKENSLVVQPVGQLTEAAFITHIQELLYNPTAEQGGGPFEHTQWGALVKFPSNPQAFVLHYDGVGPPTGPQDYSQMDPKGVSAEPRLQQEPEYTQMRYGPRADPAMLDQYDQPGDVGNPRPNTGKPGAGQPGMRFRIANGGQP
jgi:hypothetical protein